MNHTILKNRLLKPLLLLAVAFMVIFMAGCNTVGGENGSESTYQPDICPDDYVYTKEVTLTTGISQRGNPVDDKTVFSADTPEIFSVFYLSQDLCCKNVVVKWYYQDQLLAEYVETSSNYFVASIKSLEGGFERGNYEVVISIEGAQALTRIPFLVV